MILGISVDVSCCAKILPLIDQYSSIVKHIQIYLDSSPIDIMQHTIANILDKRVSYSYHAYGSLNLADSQQYTAAVQTVDALSSIGGVFINFHVGYFNNKKEHRENVLARVMESTQKLCEYAYSMNVEIHMENDICSNDGREILGTSLSDWEYIHRINQSNFRMCYDIGHANINFGDAFAYRQFLPRIGSFHIHNNDAITDLHNPCGDSGTIPLDEVLTELRSTDKYVILENEIDGYNNALKYLASLFKDVVN